MPKTTKLTKVAEEVICEAYSKHGRTLRELACFHYITPATVRNILLRHGYKTRKRGRRRNVKENEIESIESPL